MPRKPKLEKQHVTVVADGKPVNMILHPPTGTRKSWYVYWNGLVASKTTGERRLDDAIKAAEEMLTGGSKRQSVADTVPSDEEFEEIQRRHYGKKQDPDAQRRAKKSLGECLYAVSAFRSITGVCPVTLATPDDCERFQYEALQLPKNWRSRYPNSRDDAEFISPNTVIKWSVANQAAWERANINGGKKCVRGVVPEDRLLTDNPWKKFTWIEGRDTPIRQFAGDELISFLDHLESKWGGVTVATAVAKACLWSWGRKSEVMGLQWSSLRRVGNEIHFDIVGKWGVRKWFRVPGQLYDELLAIRCDSPFVFGAYNAQLRAFYERGSRPWQADRVAPTFNPTNLGDWFYERVKDWSDSLPKGPACIHVFRKTTLQYARAGEDVNKKVAADARLGERVMMTNYVREEDPELREKSNRTYHRIASSLPDVVARRYGYEAPPHDPIREQLERAVSDGNWPLVERLSAELAEREAKRDAG